MTMKIKAYCMCSMNSHSMTSPNPDIGFYEPNISRTVDTRGNNPACRQGGIAVVALEGNGARPSHRDDGYGSDVSFTLNSVERHGVAYGIERVAVENYQHSGYRECDVSGPIVASGGDCNGGRECLLVENTYVVRRLTPTECARLQGFPDWWCDDLAVAEPSEEEIAFWAEVWETDRAIKGASSKPKTRKQIIKWLKDPRSDAAEYKMWGNGVALPCVEFVLSGIAEYAGKV